MNYGVTLGLILMLFICIGTFLRKNIRSYLYLSSFIISIPAFFIYPSGDMIRFASLLSQIKSVNISWGIFSGLKWALKYSDYSNQPLVSVYLWVFSLFNKTGFLFFFTSFIFLLVLSEICISSIKFLNLKKYSNSAIVTIFIVLCCFNLFYEIEGIRNFLAFVIFVYAFMNDLYCHSLKSKIKSYFLYLFAGLFHFSSIIFLVLRIILYVKHFKIFNNKIFDIIICFFCFNFSIFNNYIINLLTSFRLIPELSTILGAFSIYSNNNIASSTHIIKYTSRSEVPLSFVIIVSILIDLLIYIYMNKNSSLYKNVSRYYIIFTLWVVCFDIGSISSNIQLYLRTAMLLLFLSIPFKIFIISSLFKYKKGLLYIYLYFYVGLSLIAFLGWYFMTYNEVIFQ